MTQIRNYFKMTRIDYKIETESRFLCIAVYLVLYVIFGTSHSIRLFYIITEEMEINPYDIIHVIDILSKFSINLLIFQEFCFSCIVI